MDFSEIKIFDCDLRYGRYVKPVGFSPCHTPAELLREAGRVGICGGLVRNVASDIVSVIHGNARLAEDLRAMPESYYGVWAIAPSASGDAPMPDKLPAAMKRDRIGALYINPIEHRFSPSPVIMGDYYAMAEERRIPLLLATDYIEQEDILRVLEAFPKLTAIVSVCSCHPTMRQMYPILEKFENVSLDLAFQWDDQGIEDITRRYGAHRMVYGSCFPELYMGGMLTMVRCADISDEDKQAILGGNFCRLMEEIVYDEV